jgi:hypothetical protein
MTVEPIRCRAFSSCRSHPSLICNWGAGPSSVSEACERARVREDLLRFVGAILSTLPSSSFSSATGQNR